MENAVVVVAVRRYDFEDEESGKSVKGLKATYLTEHNIENSDVLGLAVVNISGNYNLFSRFEKVPGIYNFDFNVYPGKEGKTNVRLSDCQFVKDIEIDL